MYSASGAKAGPGVERSWTELKVGKYMYIDIFELSLAFMLHFSWHSQCHGWKQMHLTCVIISQMCRPGQTPTPDLVFPHIPMAWKTQRQTDTSISTHLYRKDMHTYVYITYL